MNRAFKVSLAAAILWLAAAWLPFAAAHAATVTPIKVNKHNWSGAAGFGSRGPAWYKDRSGVVHLQGALTQTSNAGAGANTLGTLPPAARPVYNVFTIVHTFAGTYADLEIASTGQLNLIAPRPPAATDYTFVSLEGVTYRPSGRTSAININKANWASGSGRRTPGWFTDRSGVVHLQGTLMQASASGSGADRLGTLPTAARPSHNVFTIVLTNGGTYADLEVARNGQLNLIPPRSPAITDIALVSLEGISYRR